MDRGFISDFPSIIIPFKKKAPKISEFKVKEAFFSIIVTFTPTNYSIIIYLFNLTSNILYGEKFGHANFPPVNDLLNSLPN